VIFQAMKVDLPPDAKCRDKFLVQSVAISPERDSSNATTIVSYKLCSSVILLICASGKTWRNLQRAISRSAKSELCSYLAKITDQRPTRFM
jgi:hypothetical protein